MAVDLDKGSSYCRMCYRNNKGAVGKDGKKLLLLLRGRKNLVVEVVVWGAHSATSTYAMIVGRRDMTNTRVCLKNK